MTDGNKERVLKILDPRLPTVPLHEVMHVFYVAMLCVEEQAVERPTMREVVQMLTELPKPPNSKPVDSIVSDSPPPPPASGLEFPIIAADTKELHQPLPQSPPPPDLLSI